MVLTIVINKLRSFVLFFVALFRRALCCMQRKRRLSFDEPLTDVGVITASENDSEVHAWNDWGDEKVDRQPNTIQEHIEFYRQQKAQLQKQEEIVEQHADLFEDMMPKITRQKKVFISSETPNCESTNNLNISLVPDALSATNELGEWDENPGWEGEQLDWDALEALKMKKRQERERKAIEQQKRRMERTNKSHSIKVNS